MKIFKLIIVFFIIAVVQPGGFCAGYVYKKLPSGQTVVVYETKDNPIVTVNTWVKTGSINENDSNTGVAHFLEHLFFKGSKNVLPGEFDKILESKGALTNAATSKDYTQFYITIPSKDFELALKLHSDMLLNPLVPRKELEKERMVVLEEIARSLDSPANVMYNNLFKLIYSKNEHPYMRPVIGTKEVISTISREDILDFYNEWYTPDNMITVVSGDVDPDYAIKEVEKAFNQRKIKRNKKTYPAPPSIDKQISINEEKDVAQGYMAIGYKAPKFTNSKETYALDLLAIILGGSNSSILNFELKEKNELVNSISASYSQYLDDGLFIISSTFVPDKISVVKREIFDEIEKVKNGGITKEQLQKAKNILKTSTEYSRESAANIANEIGFFTFYFDTPKMYDEYLKQIDKVELYDVIKAANKFLIKDNSAISTVMPEGFVEVSNVAAAAKIIPNSAKVVETNGNETKYLLDNGLTLIIRKNKSNSILAFDIQAKGGAFLENKPGVAYLASANAKRGTKTFSHDELNNYLDENGINLTLSSRPDAFNISMMTTKHKQDEALKILNEVVNYPVFSTVEIDKTKRNYKEYVNSLKDRPLALAADEFSHLAYKGFPYSNSNSVTVKYIDEITRDEITSYYSKVLDAKNIVVAVTGDADADKLIKEFNKIFEDKGQKKVEVKDYLKPAYQPSENVAKKITNPGKETSWIVVGYKTPSIYNIKDIAVLKVIDSLMGTGMSSRLFKSLRENKGLAYQVGSQISQFGNDGAFYAYIGTNSKNEKEALNGILAEFNRLKTEFVPTKELDEAKEKLLGNMVIALETNMDRSAFASKYSLYGFNLSFLEDLKKEIEGVTSSDILSFANKYFSAPYIEVIVGK